MREIAYAKLNLALHVRAREPDGYHRIETVFAFCEDGDVLDAEPAEEVELAVTGRFAAVLAGEADNLVLRAAEALRERFDVRRGVRLRLDKRLPVAAGLGGGSGDAAAALRLLVRWWGLPADQPVLEEIGRGLGADVPACVASRTVRGYGRGDVLEAVDGAALTGLPVLLVNPGVPVPTGPVFTAWDGVDRGPLRETLLGRNDLEGPALSLAPEIGEVLDALAGAPFVRMSGSGATCFALCEDEAARDAAAARIGAAYPGWWVMATTLR